MRPTYQGRAVAEAAADGEWLVMLPSGVVRVATSRDEVEAICRVCRDWFRRHNPTGFGVGLIDWIDSPR